jgi:hypothetical protein
MTAHIALPLTQIGNSCGPGSVFLLASLYNCDEQIDKKTKSCHTGFMSSNAQYQSPFFERGGDVHD